MAPGTSPGAFFFTELQMLSKRFFIAGALALATHAIAQTAASPAAPVLPPETPLVVDGNITVDAADFEGNILRIPEDRRAGFRRSYYRVAAVIDNVFVTRSVAQKARDAGLDKDPAVQARLKQLQDAFLADEYMKKIEKDAQVADVDTRAREMYIADKEKYMTDEEVQMQQVLIGVKCRTKDAALELARKAHDEAVSGTDFLAVAAKYSDVGERAEKGGDLGWGPVKAFVPSVREAVAKMKKGEISEPVESPFGYHVFKLIDRKAPVQKPFEAVKKQIIDTERANLHRRKVEEVIQAVRGSSTVITYRDNVSKLVAPGTDVNELSKRALEAQKAPKAATDKPAAPEAK